LNNLNGIENLTNLQTVSCSNNKLINLKIDNLIDLVYLICFDNNFINKNKQYLKNYCIKNKINFEI
jgi:Leucine-rich repeat (LRR) protein